MNQPERELLYNYLDEMKKQTTILKQLEEQQEIMIEQNAKISSLLQYMYIAEF